ISPISNHPTLHPFPCTTLFRSGLSPVLLIGAPLRHEGRVYNCALAIADGKLLGAVPKSFLPNYREFYEKRWFASGMHVRGQTIRSEEHTSELQSRENLVCRLLL